MPTEEKSSQMTAPDVIVEMLRPALESGQFVAFYQPQYNHTTQRLIGAEALVRWRHPTKGIIAPGLFIQAMEQCGLVTGLDLYVLDKVCSFIRRCLDDNIRMVPISVNLSRRDLSVPGFFDSLEEIRQRYEVPQKYLRLEITESAAGSDTETICNAVSCLHALGYQVAMDDFGSGFSSLSVLKDIDFDIIKLDMKFLSSEREDAPQHRGGTIVAAVVRMISWLGLPLIAEGVECREQADFLQSVGCQNIQGYLYSTPVDEETFVNELKGSHLGELSPVLSLVDHLDPGAFWSEDTLESMLFSHFAGGAALFEYYWNGDLELLRVNPKYLTELGMNLSEEEVLRSNPLAGMDQKEKIAYVKAIEQAIKTKQSVDVDTWRNITSSNCGEDHVAIRTTLRLVGSSRGSFLFYAAIRNVTAEKLYIRQMEDASRRFSAASEHLKIFYWEYTVATHEMRPCARCMRELGMPPLVTNYPDSAIQAGIFPPEIAEQYREWHRQIDAGVPRLEAVLPLTKDRLPYRIRYTTEFDDYGHPVRAYGSATPEPTDSPSFQKTDE
ncbi:MAG: EAL domain-containing protein [Selenomonadaceae bacterium]|nr:EAL domain-containing protein [Selenomonadaceae bacterium]